MNISVRKWVSSSLYFTLKMMLSAGLSLLGMASVLVIVARLDVAFFEANGMLKNPLIREAFYYEIFAVDPSIVLIAVLGFLAVAMVSFIFARSQFSHYQRFERSLNEFAETGLPPQHSGVGRLAPHVRAFFEIVAKRLRKESEVAIKVELAAAIVDWPKRPKLSWLEQSQFMAVAGVLGVFFSMSCMSFFLKVSDRVVELSNSIVHYRNIDGPSFLAEQFDILNSIMVFIFLITILSFIYTGYRFSTRISTADYALLRDLKAFLLGNVKQRFFLRMRDPAQEYIASLNESLDRIEAKLTGQAVPEKKLLASVSKKKKKLRSKDGSKK